MKTPEFWIQIVAWLIAAISYVLLYKQQKSLSDNYSSLLTKYKDGYDSMNAQFEFYKKLVNMEGLQQLVDHNIAIMTPAIEKDLLDRLKQEGNTIIHNGTIFEMLDSVYRTSLWLYQVETKDQEIPISYKNYLKSEYPKSYEWILWHVERVYPHLTIQ